MSFQKIYVIDFEGTRANGIREYGVVELANFEIISTDTLQITSEDKMSLLEYFVSLRKNGVFASHESKTEDILLRNMAPVAAIGLQWGPWIDTKKIYSKCFPDVINYELKYLINTFGLIDELNFLAKENCPAGRCNFHCALYDALGAALLLKNLHKKFVENKFELSVERLFLLS